MKHMTDFIMEQEVPVVENNTENLEAAVMQEFMALNAACANIECLVEYATIAQFCEAAEIQKPELLQEFSFSDIGDFFKNIWETIVKFIKNILTAIASVFAKSKLEKLIAKVKQIPDGEFQISPNELNSIRFVECILDSIAEFKQICAGSKTVEVTLDDIESCTEAFKKKMDEYEASAKDLKDIDKEAKATAKFANKHREEGEDKIATKPSYTNTSMYGEDVYSKEGFIQTLEALIKAEPDSTAKKLMKGFDAKDFKHEEDADTKAIAKAVKKYANELAKAYDAAIVAMTKAVDKAHGKTKITDKDTYKEDLEAARELGKPSK